MNLFEETACLNCGERFDYLTSEEKIPEFCSRCENYTDDPKDLDY